jgi:hypothetical protein
LSSGLDSVLRCPFGRSSYIERPAEPENGQENEKQDRQHQGRFRNLLTAFLGQRRVDVGNSFYVHTIPSSIQVLRDRVCSQRDW